MSRLDYHKRKSPSSVTGNLLSDESKSHKGEAKLCHKNHDKWESIHRFEIIRIDAKTVKYRLIKTGEKVDKKLVHRGKI